MAITALQEKQILQVVVSVFNGGISGTNLSAIAGLVESGVGMFQLANFLANGTTYRDLVMGGKTTIPDQAGVIMKNFGFVADNDPSSAGSQANNYITAVLTEGATLGDIINSVTVFLTQDPLTLPANFAPAAALLNNKVLVAKEYIARNAPDTFEGNVAVLAGVTATGPSSLEEITAYLDNFTANAVSLTANTDDLVGTSGIDIYSGVLDGSSSTISNGDVVDAVGGVLDQLSIRVASVASGGETIAPTVSNVEKITIQNQATSDQFTLDFTNISGETQISSKGSVSQSHTRVINVDPTATAGMENSLGFYEVNFSGDRSGDTDAFTLALNGAGTAKEQAFFSTVTTNGGNDDTFEIANISSTNAMSNVFLGVDAMSLKTINVSGDANLKLAGHNGFTGLSTVDASSMTAGGLNIDARESTEANFKFVGSLANDRAFLKNTTISTASSLDGGAGSEDTLATQSLNVDVSKATNFEILERVGGVQSVSLEDFTKFEKFLFSGTQSGSNGYTISNIGTEDRVTLATDQHSNSGNYGLRLEGKSVATTAVLELRSIDTTDGEVVVSVSNNNNDRYGIEIRDNIAVLKLESTGAGEKANLIETNPDNSDTGYAFSNQTTPVFEISGSHDLTIMAKEGVDLSNGANATLRGFTHTVKADASNFTGVLRIVGSSDGDIIIGGSKGDIIYGISGADDLTGNGGGDQFRLTGHNSTTDTIKDFKQGEDKVGLNQFDFGNTTASQGGTILSTDDYVDNRDVITDIGSADSKKVVELQASLSSDQIANDVGAAVQAFVLVHNTSTNKAELWYDNDWSTSSSRDQVITFDNVIDLAGVKSFSNTDFVEFTY